VTRECDNDDCDYETYVNDDGRPRVRWIHVEGCEGPVPFDELREENAPRDSFLAYLEARMPGIRSVKGPELTES
jgi:hypothetical protein